MTCYLCNKKYTRLNQHLRTKHSITGASIEPHNIRAYAHLITLFSPRDLKFALKYYKELTNYWLHNKDITTFLHSSLKSKFEEYKKSNIIKPVLQVAFQKARSRHVRSTKKNSMTTSTSAVQPKIQTENAIEITEKGLQDKSTQL